MVAGLAASPAATSTDQQQPGQHQPSRHGRGNQAEASRAKQAAKESSFLT